MCQRALLALLALSVVVLAAPAVAAAWINVRDYGAVADGVSDDSPAIQAAIGAACGGEFAGGGVVYLPRGVYAVARGVVAASSFARPCHNLTLQGDGQNATVILAGPSFPWNTAVITLAGSDTTVQFATVRELTIRIQSVTATGIYCYLCRNLLIQRTHILGPGQSPNWTQGIVIDGGVRGDLFSGFNRVVGNSIVGVATGMNFVNQITTTVVSQNAFSGYWAPNTYGIVLNRLSTANIIEANWFEAWGIALYVSAGNTRIVANTFEANLMAHIVYAYEGGNAYRLYPTRLGNVYYGPAAQVVMPADWSPGVDTVTALDIATPGFSGTVGCGQYTGGVLTGQGC